MRSISANISSTSSGESPSEGSSRMRSSGSAIRPAADRQHLLLAAGQRAGALTLPLAQPRKGRKHAFAVLGPRRARARR